MQVKVANRIYKMSQTEYKGLLGMAKEQVPFGVYAVEKDGYAELRCDRCSSMTQLKNITRQYKQKGFRVYANKQILEDAVPFADAGGLMSAT